MVNTNHRHLVGGNSREGLGKFKNYATPSIFLKFCSIISYNYFKCGGPVTISFPKEILICPSLVRTLDQVRLSRSPLSDMASHVCICSVYVFNKKSKHNNLKGHLATMKGGINLWAGGESGGRLWSRCNFSFFSLFLYLLF